MKFPEKLALANTPTRIEKLDRLSNELGSVSLYIKRDDQTGMEWSGNKVRKLEYAVREAINQGCNLLITCGGNQSNHSRATAAVAAKMGMKCYLVLRGTTESPIEGNLFIIKMLGAEIKFITAEDYATQRNEIMKEVAAEKEKQGYKPYIIPEGASNGIGSFGYYDTLFEIINQEKVMNLNFDAVSFAVGSGGTYAGMLLAKKLSGYKGDLPGYLAGGTISYFEEAIFSIFKDFSQYLNLDIPVESNECNLIDTYIGQGYGLNTTDELEFIKHVARLEGIILDNVYTGKALYGLVSDIKKGRYSGCKNILFIHTGGMFELFSQTRQFDF